MQSLPNKTIVVSLLFLGLATALAAQSCPQGQVVLAISPTNPVPGTPMQVTVTGSPGAAVTLFHGPNAGQTILPGPGPLAGTVICLNAPFDHHPLGHIPPSGTRTAQLIAPPGAAPGATLEFQALTVAPGASGPVLDTSNTVTLTLAAPPPCTPGAVQLTITPANAAPGTALTVTVTGNPGDALVLFLGANQGSAVLPPPGPLAGTLICLSRPFHEQFLGHIPPSGTRTGQIPMPPAAPGTVVHFQVVAFGPSATGPLIDTSNVASVTTTAGPPCAAGSAILDIQPNGPVQPGGTISMNVTATPGSFVILASSAHAGSTPLPFPNLTLCLANPFHLRFMGLVPPSGTLSESHAVPLSASLPGNVTIHFQVIVVSSSGGVISVDTSNTDTLSL